VLDDPGGSPLSNHPGYWAGRLGDLVQQPARFQCFHHRPESGQIALPSGDARGFDGTQVQCIDILPFLKEGDSYRRGLRRFLGGFLLLTAYIAIHFTG